MHQLRIESFFTNNIKTMSKENLIAAGLTLGVTLLSLAIWEGFLRAKVMKAVNKAGGENYED